MHIFEKILVGTSVISVGKSTFERCVSLDEVFISSSVKKKLAKILLLNAHL